jgi:hypothetical protein
MPEITLHQIDRIAEDIRREEISFSHLLDDLIDHVCCDVEYEMQNGLSFHEAYLRVKQKMGPRRIKEIHEETLFAVDTKYRNMKKTMKFSGAAGTILLSFAAIFKIQHWPGASIMMVLGAFLLAFVFLPSTLGVLWKETHNKKSIFLFITGFFTSFFFITGVIFKIQHWPGAGMILMLAIVFGIFLFLPALLIAKLKEEELASKKAIYIIGIAGAICFLSGLLFKIQHWPGASSLMVSGVIILFFISLPWYSYLLWKDEARVSGHFIFLIVGSLAVIIPEALVNLNLQNTYEQGYYPNFKQQSAFFNYRFDNNMKLIEKYRDSSFYSTLSNVHSRTVALLGKIGEVETKLVAESEGKPGIPAISPSQVTTTERGVEIYYTKLSNPFRQNLKGFLLPGSAGREDLDKNIAEYTAYVSGLNGLQDATQIKALLNTSVFLPAQTPEAEKGSLLSGLHSLELLKNSVLTAESVVITSVTGKMN